MTTGDTSRRRESAFTLVRRLVSGGVKLAKLEVQRGRQEIARNLGQLRGGVLRVAFAAAFALAFLIALIGFVMAVLVVVGLWWVALIVLVVLLIVAGLLAWSGIRAISRTKFTPDETIAAVKEDVEWAKTRLLRRG
jgi:fatty acid desaturase